ncbi:MAG: hypothetical protein PUJ21_03095 [Clostridia bacterium]|nr:hypothetical protein [Clostridia bacterium]MDY6185285.1 hypothetical protein [Eubacteriales bacterium]
MQIGFTALSPVFLPMISLSIALALSRGMVSDARNRDPNLP